MVGIGLYYKKAIAPYVLGLVLYLSIMLVQQQLVVSMDFKRNYQSNIQPPTQIKANHLVNPLIGIEKASTPVRTRIIKPGSQLNSTPVNVHKIGVPAKSPAILNKENDSGNSKLGIKKPKATEQNLNLSPIMALNRKMSQGATHLESRTFTPNGFKRQESLSNMLEKKDSIKNEQVVQNLHDSRTSNSFRNMLESRAKTPTRIAFAQVCQKQNSQISGLGLMRTSGSAQSLLQGLHGQPNNNNNNSRLRESRSSKLMESRSFEQLINLGSPVARDDEILCSNSNEHQKKVKAKYKVVQQPEDEQILVYCSKCAINLVQKGFKVDDLTYDDILRIKNSQNRNNLNHNQYQPSNQYYDYANQTSRKLQIKLNQISQQKQNLMFAYQKQLDDVDCYYNSLISLIEQQKAKDKQTILKNKEKERISGDMLEKKLTNGMGDLNFMLRSGRVGPDQLPAVQEIESLLTEKGFGYRFDGSKCLIDKIEQKFNNFSVIFETEGRLRIQSQDRDGRMANQVQYFSNRNEVRDKGDCPLRFSFEKNMKQARKSPLAYRNTAMNALEQASQSMQGDEVAELAHNHQKKAFRTLFPEEDEQFHDENNQKGIHSPTFKQI